MHVEVPTAGSESLPRSEMGRRAATWSPRAKAFIRNILQFLVVACMAVGAYLLISSFLVRSVQVVGVSMQPTLHNRERCLLNRWIFYVREPQRGDIVVIRDPGDNGYSVKRVVGLQGDRIHLAHGEFVLNGKALREPYLPGRPLTYPKPTVKEQDIVCGKDEFIVMGDNRMNSVDSRHYGPVTRSKILGLIVR